MQFFLKSLCKETAGFPSERRLWGAFIRIAEKVVTPRVFVCPPPFLPRRAGASMPVAGSYLTPLQRRCFESLTQVFCRKLNMQIIVNWVHCVTEDTGLCCLFYKHRNPWEVAANAGGALAAKPGEPWPLLGAALGRAAWRHSLWRGRFGGTFDC